MRIPPKTDAIIVFAVGLATVLVVLSVIGLMGAIAMDIYRLETQPKPAPQKVCPP